MKIILLKDVPKIGRKYETKEIKDGYALNFLIPRGLAVSATESEAKRINIEKMREDKERKVHEDLLLKNITDLNGVSITVKEKANEKGHLFAGLHAEAIAKEIFEQTRLEIEPSFIELKHPIKEVGEHEIAVKAAGKTVKFTLIVK